MSYFDKFIKDKNLTGLFSEMYSLTDNNPEVWTTLGQDTQFIIDVDDERKYITVCFQGSKSMDDWVNNIEFATTNLYEYEGVMIQGHDGFLDAYTSAVDEGFREILKPIVDAHPDYKIYGIGHSLGGAVAQVFAFDWSVQFGKKVNIITFGSPKPWASHSIIEKVRSAVGVICLIGRTNDMVVTLPPWYDEHLNCDKIGSFNLWHYLSGANTHCTYDDLSKYDCKNNKVAQEQLDKRAAVLV